MIYHTAGVHRAPRDQYLAADDWKSPASTMAFFSTAGEIEHDDVVSAMIFADNFGDMHPLECTKQALTTLLDALEVYIVGVIAESAMWMQQLISCRFSSCLPQWQCKEIGYS